MELHEIRQEQERALLERARRGVAAPAKVKRKRKVSRGFSV